MTAWDVNTWLAEGGLHTVSDDAPDHLFLTCASYEPRTLFVAENFAPSYKASKAVIYVNQEMLETSDENKTGAHLDTLQQLLRKHCAEITVAKGSLLQSDEQLRALKQKLVIDKTKLPDDAIITIDTTTFNRDALLTALALLRTFRPKARTRALYVSPLHHGSWLTHGYREIRNITGFAGVQQPSKSTLLIILSGFEADRAAKLIEEHEPVKVLVGTGNPPVTSDFLERNLSELQVILARQEVERFDFPTTSIKGSHSRLEELLKPYLGQYNIVIAPMSTKLSTLGVLLTAEKHREIQLTYCVPGTYNTVDYSTGVRKFYSEDLLALEEELGN